MTLLHFSYVNNHVPTSCLQPFYPRISHHVQFSFHLLLSLVSLNYWSKEKLVNDFTHVIRPPVFFELLIMVLPEICKLPLFDHSEQSPFLFSSLWRPLFAHENKLSPGRHGTKQHDEVVSGDNVDQSCYCRFYKLTLASLMLRQLFAASSCWLDSGLMTDQISNYQYWSSSLLLSHHAQSRIAWDERLNQKLFSWSVIV